MRIFVWGIAVVVMGELGDLKISIRECVNRERGDENEIRRNIQYVLLRRRELKW
jgi:hypothetical protein